LAFCQVGIIPEPKAQGMKLRAQTRCSYKKNELIKNECTFVMPDAYETIEEYQTGNVA